MKGSAPASGLSYGPDRQERRPSRSQGTLRKTACCAKRAYLRRYTALLAKSRTSIEGPFGEVLRATGPMAKANPFRFSTKYQDDETDLDYYGYRYYSVSTGKWLSRDPAQEDAGGPNLYGFVRNSALNRFDACGLCDDSGSGTITCPCILAALLKKGSGNGARSMINKNINWLEGDESSKMRILDDFVSLGRDGGKLGFALVSRTACGDKLKLRAKNTSDTHERAAWIAASGELDLNAYSGYPLYMWLPSNLVGFLAGSEESPYPQSGAIIMAHELGHAYLKTEDPYNVFLVENMVRRAFGVPRRSSYYPGILDMPSQRADGMGTVWDDDMLGAYRTIDGNVWLDTYRKTKTARDNFIQQWSCH